METALYQLKIAYDGTNFLGFQKQRNGRTVQAEIENALHCLEWKGKSIIAAGRTDAGVHASGQMITVQISWQHPLSDLQKALNANLADDVAVISIRKVPDSFHPRFSALSRKYIYRIYCQDQRNPLMDRYAWRVWPAVDFTSLKKAAEVIIGKHDFVAFGKPPRDEAGTIREVFTAEWKNEKDAFRFEVKANAFLYHMVRRMVFLQVRVGQGLMDIKDLRLTVAGVKNIKPGIAPACGLELAEVEYK
jgi:tRNA pseudouridine38-40 synthase